MLKLNKIKKLSITTMAVVCALSTAAAISAGAKSEQYVHTVSLSTAVNSDTALWISMSKEAECSDTYASYPTIFDNYSSSTNKSRADMNSNNAKETAYKTFTLQKNSPSNVSVNYGKLAKGDWRLYYRHTSGGGFRSSVTTIKWY